jgi:hypothetical protein
MTMLPTKIVAGLLGLTLLAACGAPAAVTPTPLNPLAAQTNTMQSYGPGSPVMANSAPQTFTDSAPMVATGEDEAPAPEPSAAPTAEPTPAPTAAPTATPAVPLMDTGSDDEEVPAPKTGVLAKAKTFLGNVVNKAVCLFKKDC